MIICDVGPRDGLQNEATRLEPTVRAELCDRLAEAGLARIEAVSFVHPKLVPQMAGAEEVVTAMHRQPGVTYAGLVLNERGLDRALAADMDEIHYAIPVTETFAQRNQNSSVADAIATSHRIVSRSREAGRSVTVTLSVAFGCPFEGRVTPERVLAVAKRVMAVPPDEVAVADTIGVGVPSQVRELVAGLQGLGAIPGVHFHNTRNTGIANALAALEAGCQIFDASLGGTGGCPFAPRATGNIGTEDLVYLLHGMGVSTGIDLHKLIRASVWLGERLGKELPSMVARAGPFDLMAG